MHVIIWEFVPRAGHEADFENAYGPAGLWVEFFRQGDSYRGTEFLRHSLEPGRYATIDRWDSAAQYQSFHDQHAAEYQALDEQCEQLTAEERYIGSYDTF